MYEHIPILKGKYFTFYQYYVITSMFYIFLFIFISESIDLLFTLVLRFVKKKKSFVQIQDSETSADMQMDKPDILPRQNSVDISPSNQIRNVFEFTLKGGIVLGELTTVYFISFILDIMVGYQILPTTLWVMFLKTIFVIALLTPGIYRFHKLFECTREDFRKLVKGSPILVILLGVYSIGSIIFWSGFCMCLKGNDMPGIVYREVHLSTAFTRALMESSGPNEPTPCHVYATLPENALSEVFINFHINIDTCKKRECIPILEYREVDLGKEVTHWRTAKVEKSEYESPLTEYSRRNVFAALLKDLLHDTSYYFRIREPSWTNDNSILYSYKTLSSDNIRIVAGGDVGNNKLATTMNKETVARLNPDLILIGGDIAYDNNLPTGYRSWDYLLNSVPHKRYEASIDAIRVVPLLFSSGNHDLGINSYSEATILHNSHEPVFKHWFPQNTENGEIPSLSARKSHFSHKFGETLLIMSLDVGYEAAMEDDQSNWIDHKLLKDGKGVKIIQYHGPILTAGKQGAYFDEIVIQKGLEHWIPLFDKHNVTVVFENHTHSFKRSKRIKNNEENEYGTYYLGEGAWGAVKPSGVGIQENVELTEKSTLQNNVWLLEIQGTDVIKAKAYNENYAIIDEFDIIL